MKGDVSIPPLRDLPPGRLAQRREHLLFEITRERESRGALARPWPVRRRRPRRQRILVFAAAALVAVVGTASAFSGVRAFFLDRGFIGLAPEGATPSAPESGELVVHWEGWVATLPPQRDGRDIFRAWAYADGRIIWARRAHGPGLNRGIPEGANEFNSGYLEQRLTPEGVELVRSAVAGLFERSRTVLETGPADDVPLLGLGGRLALFLPEDFRASGAMEVPDGDRFVRLQWRGIGGNAQENAYVRENYEGEMATPEQLSALRRVETLLTDPASVLPPGAWAVREVRAYVPSHYAVCIYSAPPKDASQLLSMLPARAADLLRDKSRTGSEDDVVSNIDQEPGHMVVVGRSVTYCFTIETAEAREVAEALSGLDRETGWTNFALAFRLAEGVNNFAPTRIWFEPYLPHGQFTSSGPAG
jgi:hypothetical protein